MQIGKGRPDKKKGEKGVGGGEASTQKKKPPITYTTGEGHGK